MFCNKNELKMETITYNLVNNNRNSNFFYENLSKFTDLIIAKGFVCFNVIIDEHYQFRMNQKSRILTKEEYLLEIMSIGIFWNLYGNYAANNSENDVEFMRNLYLLRKESQTMKPKIDLLRGNLNEDFLLKKGDLNLTKNSVGLSLLQKWLSATGEFDNESEKIIEWIEFFNVEANININDFIEKASDFAYYFEYQAKENLSAYTEATNEFLSEVDKKYVNREDRIFCGRQEVEYHLNMVGAEIMNRALRDNFYKNKKKIVLLPACMNNNPNCKSKNVNGDLYCTNCTKDCNIAKINRDLKCKNVDSVLIPHTSGFSKILKRYENEESVGLVAVTCVLNLLTGGYEMNKLNLSSQCVFLDYCGCKKHWHNNGVATNINIDKLNSILSSN
jgi:hypothetical protein